MRALILFIFAVVLSCGEAQAGEQPTFEVGYSSFAVVGVRCSTGTAIQINATRPTGFTATPAGYRVQNQDSADTVWIGGVSVSSDTSTGGALTNLGEQLTNGSSGPYGVAKDYRSAAALVPVYCLAADAAGSAGAVLSVVWFGY